MILDPEVSPMDIAAQLLNRRRFLTRMAAAGALFTTAGAFAEELTRTPKQTEGPFYPDKLPLDTDNDLLVLNDSITPAVTPASTPNPSVSRIVTATAAKSPFE